MVYEFELIYRIGYRNNLETIMDKWKYIVTKLEVLQLSPEHSTLLYNSCDANNENRNITSAKDKATAFEAS